MSQKFSTLFFFGRPFSPIYSVIMRLREAFYMRGVKKRHRLNVPVISVGNLTMGGTGKTPLVAMLAEEILAHGLKPAIISRGYGGAAGEKVNVVSDGTEIFMDAQAAGDEPCFLAASLPGVAVLTGIVRILPCRHAVEKLGCNVLILDDGFQHMAVKRDLDLVLFSAAGLAGNSRVFPGGDLREPITALKRCSAFVITGINDSIKERAEKFGSLLTERFPDKSVFFTSYDAVATTSLQDGIETDIRKLPSPLYAFCGIAQPELFKESLTRHAISLSGFMPLKDHQPFTPTLLRKIEKQAEENSAKGIITTEKDFIKLEKEAFSMPCFSLKMAVSAGDDFRTFIRTWIKENRPQA